MHGKEDTVLIDFWMGRAIGKDCLGFIFYRAVGGVVEYKLDFLFSIGSLLVQKLATMATELEELLGFLSSPSPPVIPFPLTSFLSISSLFCLIIPYMIKLRVNIICICFISLILILFTT